MFLLEQAAYPAAQALLKDLSSTHVAIAAVLDGTIDGEVWIDRPVDTRVALLANGDAYYLAGLPDQATDSFADLKELIPAWAYLFVEDRWSDRLGDIWSNAFALPHPRVRLGLSGASHRPAATALPEGFRLAPIDQRLLDLDPGNIETVTDLMEGWASAELFLENAIGFCVLYDGSIVSHCATDSVSGSRCELGVGTEHGYRRLGLAKVAAMATIAECTKRGRPDIEWHTHASNKGSIAIAKSCGLTELDRHVAFSGNLPAENIGDLDPATCREWGLHLERASDHISWYRFHATGAWTLAGDRTRALVNLRQLVDGGWEGEAEWLEGYWAVQSLVDDPEFKAIVAQQRAMKEA
ncbi:GNAT family N-acetyltransferase [Ensifer adhaerens]|uniref:GNAT family N-acetyltransferase n=1 Tax=Ensifer adhaerens TaxID=106592 RepID=UPI00098F25FF|nr:GNAT family N-acetyltransferase [Ensifer adhaerens]